MKGGTAPMPFLNDKRLGGKGEKGF